MPSSGIKNHGNQLDFKHSRSPLAGEGAELLRGGRGELGLKLLGPQSRLGMLTAIATFTADQLSKWGVLRVLHLNERDPIHLTPFMDFAMAWNKGVSYSLLTSNSQEPLIALSLILSVVLFFWLAKATSTRAGFAFGLIIGGALGNTLDRVMHGAVADFVLLHWGSWSWYVFNLADVGIVVGVVLLIYDNLFGGAKA
jgi:signal peptidase II